MKKYLQTALLIMLSMTIFLCVAACDDSSDSTTPQLQPQTSIPGNTSYPQPQTSVTGNTSYPQPQPAKNICTDCNGTLICGFCKGTGTYTLHDIRGNAQSRTCPLCQGNGYCGTCDGTGLKPKYTR